MGRQMYGDIEMGASRNGQVSTEKNRHVGTNKKEDVGRAKVYIVKDENARHL